jgi:hypothetical protein
MSSSNTYAGRFVGAIFTVSLLVCIAYGVMRWLGADPGSLRDWVVGLLVLWWLIVVVTLPWDLHFKARAVLADAKRSRSEGIAVAESDLSYVARWARWSLLLAIALHLVSAVGLGLLQVYGISRLGYLASGAALLLMGLRPLGRAYDYLVARLGSIGRDVRYPRDDVQELRNRIEAMDELTRTLARTLDLQQADSWAAATDARLAAVTSEQEKLRVALEDLRRANEEAHRQLARDAESAASRMAEDGKVLNHVRELVRFFKEA